MEDPSDAWIHGDHLISLLGHPLVAGVHLLRDPVLETLAHLGVDHVSKVRSAKLGDLLRRRECILHILVAAGEVEDVLDGKAFELGHIDDLDLVAGDDGLFGIGQVPEVPDGNGLIAGQIRPHLRGEEPVDL